MWTRKPTALESDFTTPASLERRRFLGSAGLLVVALGLPVWARRAAGDTSEAAVSSETLTLLEKSGFVYVCPLARDGGESTCHGEVWFAWLDDAVVLNTSSTTWKARSLVAGRDRARLWVGDHGTWKRPVGSNEAFRAAPSFDAVVTKSDDAALLERLMKRFGEKYPDEFPKWEERMRKGFASGERALLRYTPV